MRTRFRYFVFVSIPMVLLINGTISDDAPKADVAFVLDTSKSMSDEQFTIMKDEVKNLIRSWEVGDEKIKVAMVSFNMDAHLTLFLNGSSSQENAMRSVDLIPPTAMGTNTHEALGALVNRVFVPEAGDRPDVPNFVILITDGRSYLPFETRLESNKLKHMGTTIFSIGIGKWVSDSELQFIASKPSTFFSFRTRKFSQLEKILGRLSANLQDAQRIPKLLDCAPYFDIAIILDSSDSIAPEDFQKEKEFVVDFISSFDISRNGVRVAVISYSKHIKLIFDLDTYDSFTPIQTAIMSTGQMEHGKMTDKAFRMARNSVFRKLRFDDSLHSIPVPRILILITSARSKYPTKTQREANRLKEAGVTIFTIGVGENKIDEVAELASEPLNKYTFDVQKFAYLHKIFADMVNTTCKDLGAVTVDAIAEGFTTVNKNPTECDGEADVMFIFQVPHSGEDYELVRAYLQTVINAFDMGEDKIRVSLIALHTSVTPITMFWKYTNKNETLAALDAFEPQFQGTQIPDILKVTNSLNFKTDTGWRVKVPKIVVIAYVGIPGEKLQAMVTDQGNKFHRQDVRIFVINIGEPWPEGANALASQPTSSHVIFAPYMDILLSTSSYLVDRICEDAKPAEKLRTW